MTGQATPTTVFPTDWLTPAVGGPATDLDLVVVLLNSHDLLAHPVDRLADLGWLRAALRHSGHPDLARGLRARDLGRLRVLREDLRTVVECTDLGTATARLNRLLTRGRALPLLVAGQGGVRLAVAADRTGYAALAARLPAALAAHVAAHGLRRLGVCASEPCRCVFVDHTRAGSRRYCCGWCNDRRAARAYRRRRSADGRGRQVADQ
jgi:predicted RNA-binding Zn ribbon-like protein